mgnify:CR=1 FL=1
MPALDSIAGALLGDLRERLIGERAAELGGEEAARHADAWIGRAMGLIGRADLHGADLPERRRFEAARLALKDQLAGLGAAGVDLAALAELKGAIRAYAVGVTAYTAALTLDTLPELLAGFREPTPDATAMES